MSKKDEILETLKSLAVAGLPFLLPPHGVALLTLANECFNSSGKLRQNKWNAEIVSRIANLDAEMEQKIRETSNFASILASAQRGALEDMEEDKVSLYANAVISAIKNEDIDNTKKHIFLNMLRDFTKLHIDILKRLQILQKSLKEPIIIQRFEFIVQYFEKHFQDIKLDTDLEYVLTDLETKRCCEIFSGFRLYDEETSDNEILTNYGKEFLAFIAEQENADD